MSDYIDFEGKHAFSLWEKGSTTVEWGVGFELEITALLDAQDKDLLSKKKGKKKMS